jgi:hypothetical protein
VALWVETLDRSLPFTFLDHKLRCGDSLVGTWLDRFRDYPLLCFDRQSPDAKYTGVTPQGRCLAQGPEGDAAGGHRPAGRDPAGPASARRLGGLRRGAEDRCRAGAAALPRASRGAVRTARRAGAHLAREDPDGRCAREGARCLRHLVRTLVLAAGQAGCAAPAAGAARPGRRGPGCGNKGGSRSDASSIGSWSSLTSSPRRAPGSTRWWETPRGRSRSHNSKEFFSNHDPLYRAYGKQEGLRVQKELFGSSSDRGGVARVPRTFKDRGNFVRRGGALRRREGCGA